MNTIYQPATTVTTGTTVTRWRQLVTMVALLLAVVSASLVGVVSASQAPTGAKALDVGKTVACWFGTDSMPAKMYQAYTTSSDEFALYSKNSVNYGIDPVGSGYNNLLELTGTKFYDINTQVLGRETDPEKEATENSEENQVGEFNAGAKVNAFDRFGVAGLKFTNYQGEWKYIVVDACADTTDIQDPKAGAYYDGRLDPMSVWDDKGRTNDVRTIQFNRGWFANYLSGASTTISNLTFFVTKGIVVFSLAVIGLAFTDISSAIGLTSMIYGGDGNEGIVKTLHEGFFLPLSVAMLGLVGIYIFWNGVQSIRNKGASEKWTTATLRSLGFFMLAIILATNAQTFLSIPSKASIAIQSITLSAFTDSVRATGDICTSDVASVDKVLTDDSNVASDITGDMRTLNAISTNFRSELGCSFWEVFLFKPWAEAQFGSDWNTLWSKEIPEWANQDTAEVLETRNADWVGEPAVPMGGGVMVNNWALFQLSAQTNVHNPTGTEGDLPRIVDGVSTDWWRIVDAISNYAEEGERRKTGDSTIANMSGDLQKPTPGNFISGYGLRERQDVTGNNFHFGIDTDDPAGTPIESIADGIVRWQGVTPEGAVCILIYHPALDVGSFYAHMQHGSVQLKEGDTVKKGDYVGKVGDTGDTDAAHLHLEIRIGDVPWYSFNEKDTTDPAKFFEEGGIDAFVDYTDLSESDPNQQDTYARVLNPEPLDQWDSWTGNAMGNRIGTAFTSVLVAGVGLFAPAFMGTMTAVYAVLTDVAMVVAPLMLLMAAGPKRTYEVFTQWLRLLGSLIVKRIVAGLMMVLSLILTMAALRMVSDVSWWQGMLMLVIFAIAIFALRKKIMELFQRLGWESSGIGNSFNRATGVVTNVAKGAGRTGLNSMAGGVAAKRNGGSFRKAVIRSAGAEMKNMAFKHSTTRRFIQQRNEIAFHNQGDPLAGFDNANAIRCAFCQNLLFTPGGETSIMAGRDTAGNYYCTECLEEGRVPDDTTSVPLDSTSAKERGRSESRDSKDEGKRQWVKSNSQGDYHQTAVETVRDSKATEEAKEKAFEELLRDVAYDVQNVQRAKRVHGVSKVDIVVPNELAPYLDHQAVKDAWDQGNYDYIMAAYSIAWSHWWARETGSMRPDTLEEIVTRVQQIDVSESSEPQREVEGSDKKE